jgi:type IV pilus assembly protein PilA
MALTGVTLSPPPAVPAVLAPPPVAPPSPQQQKAALREEARTNLRALYHLQRQYFEDEETFTADLGELGFAPETGNRYAYYAAMKGPGGSKGRRQGSFVIPVDRDAFPRARTPKTLKEAGCSITLGATETGEAVGLGLSASRTEWTGYAIGNLDTDGVYDCWSISTVERTARSGAVIPAGEPWLEKED